MILLANFMNNLDALYRLCVLLFISLILFYLYKNSNYKKETYYQVTKHSYISVLFNKGSYGEYLTYKNLKRFEAEGAKFLFNVYIPMRQGKTTEIDVVMISSKGVFVLESKNYSGWIFGDEEQQYWYQTLPMSKWGIHKEKFYNPIKQNNTHIKYLKKILL